MRCGQKVISCSSIITMKAFLICAACIVIIPIVFLIMLYFELIAFKTIILEKQYRETTGKRFFLQTFAKNYFYIIIICIFYKKLSTSWKI